MYIITPEYPTTVCSVGLHACVCVFSSVSNSPALLKVTDSNPQCDERCHLQAVLLHNVVRISLLVVLHHC